MKPYPKTVMTGRTVIDDAPSGPYIKREPIQFTAAFHAEAKRQMQHHEMAARLADRWGARLTVK